MNDNVFLRSTVEALILASPEPIPARRLAQVVNELTPGKAGKLVEELNEGYTRSGSSVRIRTIAGGYQHYILPDYAGYVEEMFTRRRKLRLTRAALETAAIVAYKQPVTKAEIEQVRGVASDGVINNLLDKKMIVISGRSPKAGRALQYSVADEFFKFFGLASLDDLPKMSEIEDMLSSDVNKDQTELELSEKMDESSLVKLNVADGTYRPDQDDSGVSTEPETAGDGGVKLVLAGVPEEAVATRDRVEPRSLPARITDDSDPGGAENDQSEGSHADSD